MDESHWQGCVNMSTESKVVAGTAFSHIAMSWQAWQFVATAFFVAGAACPAVSLFVAGAVLALLPASVGRTFHGRCNTLDMAGAVLAMCDVPPFVAGARLCDAFALPGA